MSCTPAERTFARARYRLVATLALVVLGALALTARASAALLYGIDNTGIYQIDTSSYATSKLLTFTTPFNDLIACEAETSAGMLYFIEGSKTDGSQALYSYNPATPSVQPTLLGTTGAHEYMPRMAIDAHGVIWGMATSNNLYTVNPANGTATLVAAVSGIATGYGGDIAFGTGGSLYAGVAQSLYSVPQAGGAATLYASLGGGVNTITGMWIDPSGIAYTSDTNGNIFKTTGLPSSPVSTLIATVTIPSGASFGDLAGIPVPLTSAPSIALRKTDNGGWIAGQAGAQYTLTVSNAGTSSTTGTITVTDTLPAGLTASANPSGTGWSCSGGGTNAISCTSSTAIAAGANGNPITVPVSVPNGTPASITNTALAYGGGDPVHTSSSSATSASKTTTVGAPTLTVTKTDSSPWAINGSGTYTIVVKNTGTVATVGQITLSDPLPSALTIGAGFVTPSGWTCTATSGSTTLSCTSNAGTSIAAAAGQTFTLPIVVGTGTPNAITNVASAYGGADPAHGTAGTAATGSDVATLGPTPLLSVSKTTDKSSWPLGSNVGKYTITITNNGTANTSGTITVTDTLPSGLTFNGTPSGGGFTCTVTNNSTTMTCTTTGVLNAGQNTSINAPVSVAVGVGASVTNTASAYGGGDPTHSASAPAQGSVTQTIALPSLTVTKTDNGPFVVGNNYSYTITVNNAGAGATTGTITVNDTLPSGLTLNGNPGGGGFTCTSVTNGTTTVTCTSTNSLNANQSASFTIGVTVGIGTASSVTNTAYAYGGGDPAHATSDSPASGGDTTAVSTSSATNLAIGPNGNASASGSYNGVVATNNNNDFTAVGIQRGTGTQTNANGSGVPISVTLSASTAPCIAHTLAITSGGAQDLSITAVAPAGWQVGLYSNATCTTALSGSVVGASTTGDAGSVHPNHGTAQIYSQYTSSGAITVTPYQAYDAILYAFQTGHLNQGTNTTHDELFYGFVSVAKTNTVTHSTCAGGSGACPGSLLQYTLTYTNTIPAAAASSESTLSPLPYSSALTLSIVDNPANGGVWGNYGVLYSAPTDSPHSGTTFSYTLNGTSQGTYVGANGFSANIGSLAPGASSTITFTVIIH